MDKKTLVVAGNCERAQTLAEELGLELTDEPNGELYLKYENDALILCQGSLTLCGDFNGLSKRISKANLKNEALIKACKIKGSCDYSVFDATAGLGEDSFVLSAAGFRCELYEYNPVIAKLLEDALDRAKNSGFSDIVSRMTLHCEDSIEALKRAKGADIVYLDPMFPQRQKSSLIKKKFQLLQQLESPCNNEEELFLAARSAHPAKIVVKRPSKAEYLAGQKPSYTIEGSTVRYDCYYFDENAN